MPHSCPNDYPARPSIHQPAHSPTHPPPPHLYTCFQKKHSICESKGLENFSGEDLITINNNVFLILDLDHTKLNP